MCGGPAVRLLPAPSDAFVRTCISFGRARSRRIAILTDSNVTNLEPDLRLIVLDVDGVLTTGELRYGAEGEGSKTFHVRDGVAIKAWMQSGRAVAILTSRGGPAVAARAAELGISIVRMGAADKLAGLAAVCAEAGCGAADAAYIGDDLPDLGPMVRCGFAGAPGDASATVKRAADYVARKRGGQGAAAEIIEMLLRRRGEWAALTGARSVCADAPGAEVAAAGMQERG